MFTKLILTSAAFIYATFHTGTPNYTNPTANGLIPLGITMPESNIHLCLIPESDRRTLTPQDLDDMDNQLDHALFYLQALYAHSKPQAAGHAQFNLALLYAYGKKGIVRCQDRDTDERSPE